MDHSAPSISIADFINKELILFSQADNVRSIPSMMDGLKPGQRKILFACFKRKLKAEIKVMQLAGYVSEHAAYHHGEQSLCTTMVGLAQTFVGSNNVNLLEPNGQFGTRLQGGKDAASPRYIFTALSAFARALFRPEDDALLKYLNDDGQSIEPEWYVPILPMVLVNGSEGIGTGWSTSIPSYNPGDIARALMQLMAGGEPGPLHPWYSGFRGRIEPVGAGKYRVCGTVAKLDGTTLEITELPVGTWTQTYKEFLEAMLAESGGAPHAGFLKDYKEYHTDTTVRFVLSLAGPEAMAAAEAEGLERRLRLATQLSTSNLVCFDHLGRIKKFAEPAEILREFYDLRLAYYQRRKDWLAGQLTLEWTRLDNRVRFITEIVEGRLVVQNRKRADILAELRAKAYHADTKASEGGAEAEGEAEPPQDDGPASGYDYLLRMPIASLTRERIELLRRERQEREDALNGLLSRSPKDLWRADLEAFLELWEAREESKALLVREQEQRLLGAGAANAKGKGVRRAPAKRKALSDEDSEAEPSDESEYEAKPVKKPAAAKPAALPKTQTLSGAASARLPAASRQPAAPKASAQAKLDGFVRAKPAPAPLLVDMNSEDELELPLAERINRMLARKASPVASCAASAAPTSKPASPPPAAPAPARRQPAPARKRKAILISDDESQDEGESQDESVFEVSD
jgi:DNA topoisomerase-2